MKIFFLLSESLKHMSDWQCCLFDLLVYLVLIIAGDRSTWQHHQSAGSVQPGKRAGQTFSVPRPKCLGKPWSWSAQKETDPHPHKMIGSISTPFLSFIGRYNMILRYYRNRFFPDPGSQDHIFKSFLTIFLVKSSIILWKLAQIFFFSPSKLK